MKPQLSLSVDRILPLAVHSIHAAPVGPAGLGGDLQETLMKRLEKQLKALQDHLTNLSARADKARGQTRRRLKRLERRTRVKVERTVRALKPKVRQAVAEAAMIARGVRAGVRAGVAAYREGRPRKR
jgi:hypothetical protein